MNNELLNDVSKFLQLSVQNVNNSKAPIIESFTFEMNQKLDLNPEPLIVDQTLFLGLNQNLVKTDTSHGPNPPFQKNYTFTT